MNNKGFAVTTILYGIMVLFCLLLVSLLSILSAYRKTQDKLINENNGARSIIAGSAESTSGGGSGSGGGSSGTGTIKYKVTFVCGFGEFNKRSSEIEVDNGETLSLNEYSCINLPSRIIFSGWSKTNGINSRIITSVTVQDSDVTLYGIYDSTIIGPPSSIDSTM